ncbi:glycosyltransferase family 4 protein [Gelidibacter salicanalis]|uniref:Glycosyltransferase family 4 protein n=1 Tax=Gelidibacter salicanalis TaxID=291193 RepID=A0A934KRK0_9FLAO|nr:glycosyltransferase family 4 protein [Gelidibacter salicanalis]MBJ7879348.1 glycosyltransferase family 4 protein [Gelidibacter salicanalis]
MKILHVSGASVWGGNEQQLFDLIYGLNKLHIENVIFCFENSAIEERAIQNTIPYLSMPKAKALSLNYAKSLRNYVKEHQPDILHLHTSNSVTAYVISDVLFGLKIPTVFSKKGISGSVSFLSFLKYNYRGIKKIICVSKAVEVAFKKVLKPKNHHKLCVVYDGIKVERSEKRSTVSLRKEFSIPDSSIIIGNIANHAKAKDLVTLVKTANELVHELNVKNVCFIQIGKEGKHTADFMPLIKEYGLEPYFVTTGFQEYAMDLLPQMDIFIITSEREGGPTSILDSMYRKVPVVTTKIGVTTEAIKHNENGLLADVKDYKKLAENLKYLSEDKELQKVFAEKSYELLFQKFTTKQLAEQTLENYRSIS